MKKNLIISHERSGTSLAINLIAGHYKMYAPEYDEETCLRVDLDGGERNFADPEEMVGFLTDPRFKGIPIKNAFKSHHHHDYFQNEEVWKAVMSEYHVFYIYRDGRDVLTSYWRHVRKQGFLWGPMTFDVSEFMRAGPCGAANRYHGKIPPGNMVQRWSDHILSWMNPLVEGVKYLRFEDMLEKTEDVVYGIGDYIGEERPDPNHIGLPKLGGVHPWRGVSGNWREFFDEEPRQWANFYNNDIEFFNEFASEAMEVACLCETIHLQTS